MTRIPNESPIPRSDQKMNSVFYSGITDVKAAYIDAYKLASLTPVQIGRKVSKHFTSQETFLRNAFYLPCSMEVIVRLAVHFDCQYHEVLRYMAREYLSSQNKELKLPQPRKRRVPATPQSQRIVEPVQCTTH